MLDQLRDGDVVVVARLDRLARSTRDLLEIAEQLKDAGAGLRSLAEPWADTTSPAGRRPGPAPTLSFCTLKLSLRGGLTYTCPHDRNPDRLRPLLQPLRRRRDVGRCWNASDLPIRGFSRSGSAALPGMADALNRHGPPRSAVDQGSTPN